MFRHYLLTALRNAWRHRVTTAINIFGLALGLTFLVLTYGVLAIYANGDRNIPHSDRIYYVAQQPSAGDDRDSLTPGALAAYLRMDYPGLEYVSHIRGAGLGAQGLAAGNNRTLAQSRRGGRTVSSGFSHCPFSFKGVRPEQLWIGPNSIVLTRSTAQS